VYFTSCNNRMRPIEYEDNMAIKMIIAASEDFSPVTRL